MSQKKTSKPSGPAAPRVAEALGLQVIPRSDGSYRLLWRASKAAIDAGYTPKSISIKFDILDPCDHDDIREICQEWQAKMTSWLAAKARTEIFDGTFKSLSRLYQQHESSPFHTVKHNTRALYTYELGLIEAAIGECRIRDVSATDFTRWHKAMIDVDGAGARKAQGFLQRVRAIIAFGVVAEVPGCPRLDQILSKMRFPVPARRVEQLTYAMATAIIARAHDLGRPSVALAQAIQFETGLRQADVIGLYEPCAADDRSPYRTGKRRWVPGLLWQDIDDRMVITMRTSKTGATVTHNLAAMPLVAAEIARIPANSRIGPMIVSEATGRPYIPTVFSRTWRRIADQAGVPKSVWNRDSRSGALSEGDEAGADLADLQRMAGHTTQKMTAGYVRGQAVEKSTKIAELRVRRRGPTDQNA
jgi:integrase